MRWDHSTERREKLRKMQLSEKSELLPVELERLDGLPPDWPEWSGKRMRDAVGEKRTWDGLAAIEKAEQKEREPSIGDLAVEVLREKGPLHYQEVTRILLEDGLPTAGNTPDRTIGATLSQRVGKDVDRLAPGVYTARSQK